MATYLKNRKATLDYEILEKLQAGMELLGHEVKSIRGGMGSLEGGRVVIRGNEAYLVGVKISAYQPNNTPKNYDPERSRRLLLTKKEITELAGAERKSGLTVIPISVYNAGRNLKLEVAIARGKKKGDKRESLKKKSAKRDVEREAKFRLN
jgi:SsrA-binding protein